MLYEKQNKWTEGSSIDVINKNLKAIVESMGINSSKFKCNYYINTSFIESEYINSEQNGFGGDLVADLGFSVGTKFIIYDALSLNAGYEIELIDLTEDYYSFKNTNIFFGMTYLFVRK